MSDYIIEILRLVLPVVVTGLAGTCISLIVKKIGVENMKKVSEALANKESLASIAVRFVEQAYVDLHGNDKLYVAVEWMSDQLQAKGIEVDEDEIIALIESALRKFKDEFGENWAKSTNILE